MKRVIGIIAEYNPFHKGHIYHIEQIKNKYPDSIIVALISGNVVQRGEFSIVDKFEKTRLALKYGVDLVIELPAFYTLNNANIFAYGAVWYLNLFRVDEIIFGSESNDLAMLNKLSEIFYDQKLLNKLEEKIMETHSFPKSFSDLIDQELNIKELKSNDILGFCYISSVLIINKKIKFSTIKRDNINYLSASKIRGFLKEDLNEFKKHTEIDPKEVIIMDDFLEQILAKILTNDFSKNNHLFNHLKKIINKEEINDWNHFLQISSTKNFTKSSIAREVMKFYLNIKNDQNITPRILGLSKDGRKYLANLKIKYNTKFKPIYQNDLTIAMILNLKKKDYLSKEIKQTIILE